VEKSRTRGGEGSWKRRKGLKAIRMGASRKLLVVREMVEWGRREACRHMGNARCRRREGTRELLLGRGKNRGRGERRKRGKRPKGGGVLNGRIRPVFRKGRGGIPNFFDFQRTLTGKRNSEGKGTTGEKIREGRGGNS